jgi:ketosteroid isomerase-like protein
MKKFLTNTLSLASLTVLFYLFAVAQEKPVTIAEDDSTQEVRRLNKEECDAFLHKDSRTLARLWSDDFVVTNPLNNFVNKHQVLGMVDSGFLVITSYDRKIEYARVYGDTAIVAGSETVTWGGKMPNAGKAERLRFTAVWMRQGGRWQEIARHANILP